MKIRNKIGQHTSLFWGVFFLCALVLASCTTASRIPADGSGKNREEQETSNEAKSPTLEDLRGLLL